MRVDGFEALRVEWAASRGATAGKAHGDRAGKPCAPEHRSGLVYDLVKADRGEVCELHFHDGSHSLKSGTNRGTDHRVFTNGRVHHPIWKALGKRFCRFECPAERTNILAVDIHAGVGLKGLALRLANGFEVGDQENTEGWTVSAQCVWAFEKNSGQR